MAERSSAISRVARPTLGSPVIFSSNGSPLKEFLDSPLTRQAAKHNKQLEDKNGELREIKAELDRERMEKHFLQEETCRLRQERKRLESDNCDLKIKVKEVSEARMNESTGNNIDTSDLYHSLLKEHKEQEKYLVSVQHQLFQVEEENSVLQGKLAGVTEKLASATKQKISAELSVDDMKTNLTAAQDENSCLSDNVEELKCQIEDLNWQIHNSLQCGNTFSSGRKSFAPSMASVHLTADMTDISMDADDSISALGTLGDISENLGDVVGRQQQERIDDLEREKLQLDEIILNDQKKISEVEKDLECKKEFIEQLSDSVKILTEEKNKVMESYKEEKIQRGIEVDGLRLEVEGLKEKLVEETETASRTISELRTEQSGLHERCSLLESRTGVLQEALDVKTAELQSSMEKERNLKASNAAQQSQVEEQISLLQREKHAVETSLGIVQFELEQTKISVQNGKEESEKMERNLSSQLVEARQMLEAQIEESSGKLSEQQKKIEGLEGSQAELAAVRREELASAEERLDAIQSEKFELVLRIETLEQDCRTLQQDSDRLSLLKGKMESEISGLKEHSQNLRDKLSEKDNEVETLKDDMETQRKYQINKDADLRSAQDKIKDLEMKINNIEESKGREISNIKTDLEQKCLSLQNLHKTLHDTKQELQTKEEDSENYLSNLNRASSTLGAMKAELAEARDEIDNLKSQITAKTDELTHLKKSVEDSQFKMEALITEKHSTVEHLEMEKSSILDINSVLEKDLETWKTQMDSASKLNSQLEQELVQLKKQLDESEAEMRNVISLHAQKINTLEFGVASHKAEEEKLRSEAKEIEEILESNELKRQELEFEKQKLEESLDESREACHQRGIELSQAKDKVDTLQSKIEMVQKENEDNILELKSQVEFLQSHLEQTNEEKDILTEKSAEMMKHSSQLLSKVTAVEDQLKQSEAEKISLTASLTESQMALENWNREKEEFVEKISSLEGEIREVHQEKETCIAVKIEENCEVKNKLKSEVESMNKIITEKDGQISRLMADISCVQDTNSKLEGRNRDLEENLSSTLKMKDDLAASVSSLLTNTNEVKENAKAMNTKHEAEKRKLEKRIEELMGHMSDLQNEMKDLTEKEEEVRTLKNVHAKCSETIDCLKAEIEKLQRDLAETEIKFTDLELNLQNKESTNIEEALKQQKKKYEENHKKILGDQGEKYKSKLQEMAKYTQEMIDQKDAEFKKTHEEKEELAKKCENYKKHLAGLAKKQDELEELNKAEADVYQEKYENVLKKYEAAKMVIERLNAEKEQMKGSVEGVTEIKKENAKLKADNKQLTNMYNFADTKLREQNRNVENKPVRRSRESSISSISSLDSRSRDCINSSLQQPDIGPRTSSRQSISRENSNNSIVRARPSVPGRADRMTTRRMSTNLDDSVFKVPGPNTPGRAKTGRTVSDSRMKYNRPPTGAGAFFNCDEEDGEMFSNSYLMDLKAGECDLDSSSRMSELARRNTLCPPHLKSSYPVESQFCADKEVTEDDIRQSRLPSKEDTRASSVQAAPSPVSRLSKLSISDSPASSTRSKRGLLNKTRDEDEPPAKLPPPVAFNIDLPRPGAAVRKGTRATKQACVGDHGVKKEACREKHIIPEDEEHFEEENSQLGFDDSVISPGSRKRKSQGKIIKTEEDLNMSQVSFRCFV